jgi:DNA-directed RNA polymerase subunit RPC12/RpoP
MTDRTFAAQTITLPLGACPDCGGEGQKLDGGIGITCSTCNGLGLSRDAGALLDAAVRFRFGNYYVEHLVDTRGRVWGWVVSKDGKWAQNGMTREEAIAEGRRLADLSLEQVRKSACPHCGSWLNADGQCAFNPAAHRV